ncbi:hypothetical protein NUSPORA_01455 [Nucleospora cyclopteri]
MYKLKGYITSYDEAAMVIHACRLGFLRPMERRLTNEEKNNIESGDIYCFIETENGMKRWTDGRIWSPSKILGEFLLYQEVPKYLSKNSIKKRKHINFMREHSGLSGFPDVDWIKKEISYDKTNLCKKTVCISYDKKTYRIVSYYRPIFATYPISQTPFFQSLTRAISKHPELRTDEFINKIKTENKERYFWEEYKICPPNTSRSKYLIKYREIEKVAAEALMMLSKIYR